MRIQIRIQIQMMRMGYKSGSVRYRLNEMKELEDNGILEFPKQCRYPLRSNQKNPIKKACQILDKLSRLR